MPSPLVSESGKVDWEYVAVQALHRHMAESSMMAENSQEFELHKDPVELRRCLRKLRDEVVSSGDEVEVIPKHELSLQERLSNLAGITLPNQSPPHREPPHREPPRREPPQNEGGIRPWGAPQQQQPPHSHHQDTGPGPGKSYFKALESQNQAQNHHQEGPSKSYNKALEMAGKFLFLKSKNGIGGGEI